MLSTSANPGVVEVVAILTGYLAGAALCGTLVALVMGYGRRFASGAFFRWINAICGLALSWFGVRLLWTTLQRGSRWLAPALRTVG